MFKEFEGNRRELRPEDVRKINLLRNFAKLKYPDQLEISSNIAELKTKKTFTDLIEAGFTELAHDLLFDIADSMINKRLEPRESEPVKVKEEGPAPAPDRTRFRDDELVERLAGMLEEKFDVPSEKIIFGQKERPLAHHGVTPGRSRATSWNRVVSAARSHGKRGRDTAVRKNMRGEKKISELPVHPMFSHDLDETENREELEALKQVIGGEPESKT